jgi:D-alanyl-D-alanine carboxypeptidase (penicillin-binding protein 5/6)
MPVLDPGATVVASRRAANQIPSKVGLVRGNSYKISDLFKALLMISANDAAVALAQATGSYATGMALINAEAHHLQAYDTVAVRPNGLDAPGQRVSAYDEALFARRALAVPAFMRDEALRKFRFQLRPHGTRRHPRWENLWTQNGMLYTFPGDLGGKIGWTTPAGATYIGWARRGHTTLLVSILHCPPGTELTVASRLLRWGFAVDGKVRPTGHLVSPLPAVAAHPPITLSPAVHLKRPLPARMGLPAISLTVGFAALLLAVVTTTALMIIGGRRRGGSPPGR